MEVNMKYRDRWEAEAALRRTLPTLAADVAREMGDGWTSHMVKGHYVAYVHGQGGERISLMVEGPDRIAASGTFIYDGYTGDLDHGRITIAVKRGAVALAKEIRRRLLPKYLPSLAIMQERERQRDERENYQVHVLHRVQKMLGAEGCWLGHGWKPGNEARMSRYRGNSARTLVVVKGSGSVQIEVDGSLEELTPILEWVARLDGGDW